MKKICLRSLIYVVVFMSMLLFSACVEEHSHVYGQWKVLTPATCTQNEILIRYCLDCNQSETQIGAFAIGHDYEEWRIVKDASCSSYSVIRHDCKKCDHFETKNGSTLANHVYNIWYQTKPATCESSQQLKRDCIYCSHFETKIGTPAKGHSYDEWFTVTQATCVKSEILRHNCINCYHYETKSGANAKGHSYDEWFTISSATCITGELSQHNCKNCNHIETKRGTSLAEHTYSDWYQLSSATCTTYEQLIRSCSFCKHSEIIKGTVLLEHKYLNWETLTPATCTHEEVLKRQCADCSAFETKPGATRIDHTYSKWETSSPATCTHEEVLKRQCIYCNVSETKKGAPITDHTYNDWETLSNATCQQAEILKRYCTYCNFSETKEGAPITGHKYSNWQSLSSPTCIQPEILKRKCTFCDAYETKNGASALGHNYTHSSQVTNPTISSNGYTTHYCICGEAMQDNYTCLVNFESIGLLKNTLPAISSHIVTQNTLFLGLEKTNNFFPIEYRIYSTETTYTNINKNYVITNSLTITVLWKTQVELDFDGVIEKIDNLQQISCNYNKVKGSNNDPQIRVLQYIRQSKYGTSTWNTFGGTIESDFASYVTANQGSYNLQSLQSLSTITIPLTNEKIDFVHMIAIMNVIAKNGLTNTSSNDMVGWGGDLCQLVQQLSQSNLSGTALEKKSDELLGGSSSTSTFSLDDLLADLDALNIMHIYFSLTSKSVSQAIEQYYSNLSSASRLNQVITNGDKASFSNIINSSKTIEKMADEIVSRLHNSTYIQIWCLKEGLSFSSDSVYFKAASTSLVKFLINSNS